MKKMTIATLALILSVPLMLITSSADASAYRYYRHHCCGCWGAGMPLVYHVVRELRADPSTADQSIWVSARGHRVILSGTVGNVAQKYVAVDIARYTCGVRMVEDDLHVIQPSR